MNNELKSKSIPPPNPLREGEEIIDEILDFVKEKKKAEAGKWQFFYDVLPEDVRDEFKPYKIEGQKLFVHVTHPIWGFEYREKIPELIRKMHRKDIKNIIFR